MPLTNLALVNDTEDMRLDRKNRRLIWQLTKTNRSSRIKRGKLEIEPSRIFFRTLEVAAAFAGIWFVLVWIFEGAQRKEALTLQRMETFTSAYEILERAAKTDDNIGQSIALQSLIDGGVVSNIDFKSVDFESIEIADVEQINIASKGSHYYGLNFQNATILVTDLYPNSSQLSSNDHPDHKLKPSQSRYWSVEDSQIVIKDAFTLTDSGIGGSTTFIENGIVSDSYFFETSVVLLDGKALDSYFHRTNIDIALQPDAINVFEFGRLELVGSSIAFAPNLKRAIDIFCQQFRFGQLVNNRNGQTCIHPGTYDLSQNSEFQVAFCGVCVNESSTVQGASELPNCKDLYGRESRNIWRERKRSLVRRKVRDEFLSANHRNDMLKRMPPRELWGNAYLMSDVSEKNPSITKQTPEMKRAYSNPKYCQSFRLVYKQTGESEGSDHKFYNYEEFLRAKQNKF